MKTGAHPQLVNIELFGGGYWSGRVSELILASDVSSLPTKCVMLVVVWLPSSMADFDERSGIVSCKTPWGLWYQTLDEVAIEINADLTLKAKDVVVKSKDHSLDVEVADKQLIKVR